MTTFYIDPTSPTNGTGTFASPYNSWASVTWAAGNTYLQKENTEFFGTVTINVGGTSELTRVIAGTYDEGTGVQLFKGDRKAKINANGNQYGIVVTGIRHYVRIQNLEVYGARHTSSATGVYMGTGAGTNFEVLHCIVRDIKNSNGSVGAAGIKFFSDFAKIKHNVVFDMGDDGVYGEGDGVELSYNMIYKVSLDGIGGDCIQLSDSVISTNNPWVHHNYLDHSNLDTKQCFIITSGGAGGSTGGGLVENNTFIGYASAITNKPLYLGNPNMIAQHNYIFGGIRCIDADVNSTGTIIRSNIIVNYSEIVNTQGVVLTAASCSVYNNTILNLIGTQPVITYGIQVGNLANTVIKNNIISGWRYGVRIHTGNPATEEYNCLYSNTVNKVNESLNSVTLGTGTITTNPQLSPSYLITNQSSAYRAGVFVTHCRDKDNNVYYNPPSMGAYEYITGRTSR